MFYSVFSLSLIHPFRIEYAKMESDRLKYSDPTHKIDLAVIKCEVEQLLSKEELTANSIRTNYCRTFQLPLTEKLVNGTQVFVIIVYSYPR
jgi:hypothetical protein